MNTDELIVAMCASVGRNVKDIGLLKKEFFLTIYGGELKLMHRSVLERGL